MRKQEGAVTHVESLMKGLASKDGAARQKARISLVSLGGPAVAFLTRALQNSKSDHVRWEAAKALGMIGNPKSIPGLVKALEDSDPDVAWLAAEALRGFRMAAWPALFRALTKSRKDSIVLRQGAHHVLRDQKVDGFNDLLAALTKALESNTAQDSAPIAAYDLLKRLRANSQTLESHA